MNKWRYTLTIAFISTLLISCGLFSGEKQEETQAMEVETESSTNTENKSGTSNYTYPIAYVTDDRRLIWQNNLSNESDITTFYLPSNPSNFPLYYDTYNGLLFYFLTSENDDGHNEDDLSLYAVNVSDREIEKNEPVLVDEHIYLHHYNPYFLANGALIYRTVNILSNHEVVWSLKYYDGSSPRELLPLGNDGKFDIFCNRDRNIVYIRVEYSETHTSKWYRMDINDTNPEFICENKSYLNYVEIVNQDAMIFMENNDNHGYYALNLYVHGKYKKTLIQNVPDRSVGPFEVEMDGDSISFYLITTVDGKTTSIADEQGYADSIDRDWNFFKYQNGQLIEADPSLRRNGDDGRYAMEINDFYQLDNELVCRSESNRLFSIKKANGYLLSEKSDLRDENGSTINVMRSYVVKDCNGKRMLLIWQDRGNKIYIYSDGECKEIATSSYYDFFHLYNKGEAFVLYITDGSLFIRLNDISFEDIDKNNMQQYELVDRKHFDRLFSDDEYMYILYKEFLHWLWRDNESPQILQDMNVGNICIWPIWDGWIQVK